MSKTLEIGTVVIIDGVAWTVESFKGDAARAVHTDDASKAVWFDRREAKPLAASLWGLPGRIEPPAVTTGASVVASVAVASTAANG